MAIELYNQKGHVCLMFTHLSDEGGEAVQANQFLIVHEDHGCIIDPGGNMAYNELLLTIGRYFRPRSWTKSRLPCRPRHHCLLGPLDDQHTGPALHLQTVGAFCPPFLQAWQDAGAHCGHSRCGHAHPGGRDRAGGPARTLHAFRRQLPVLGSGQPHPVFATWACRWSSPAMPESWSRRWRGTLPRWRASTAATWCRPRCSGCGPTWCAICPST